MKGKNDPPGFRFFLKSSELRIKEGKAIDIAMAYPLQVGTKCISRTFDRRALYPTGFRAANTGIIKRQFFW